MKSNRIILSVLIAVVCLADIDAFRLERKCGVNGCGRLRKRFIFQGQGKPIPIHIQGKTTQPPGERKPVSVGEALQSFSIELFKQAEPIDRKSGNKFISPYSVLVSLMFTMLGTAGNTEKQLMSTLQLDGVQTRNIHQEFKNFQNSLNNNLNKNITFTIANRLFPRLGIQLNKQYEIDAKRYYDSGVEALDFIGDPEGSRMQINEWAKNKTNNIIKEALPIGIINSQTIMILLNAIYFKGDWKIKFDKRQTVKRDFYITAATTERVDMMTIFTNQYRFGISTQFDCRILELPYRGDAVSMVIILPNHIDGLQNLENHLSASTLASLYSSLWKSKITISIPKFDMLSSFNLIQPLQQLGIHDLFHNSANFSVMSNMSRGIHVSNIQHKARLKVDEEGTEAAAVTSIANSGTGLEIPMSFIANHPFIFLIRENKSGSILFIGRYSRHPN